MKNILLKISFVTIFSCLLTNCSFPEKSKCDNEQVKSLLLELTSNQIAAEFFIHKAIEDKNLEGLLSISFIEFFSGQQLKGIANEKLFKEFIEKNVVISEIRTDKLNPEIQKCFCSANIKIKNGYAYYAVSYSAQITEDERIYVELIQVPERIEIEEGKLASDIWKIRDYLNKKKEQEKDNNANSTEATSIPEDAPAKIYEYAWKFNVNGEEKIIITSGEYPQVEGEFISVDTKPIQ